MQKIISKFSKTDGLYILLLATICVIGYWQISFGVHPLKWDMIDYFFPMRNLISNQIQNGFLPLWNPYTMYGQPIHSDPQSGAWYPILWIISLLFKYDLVINNIEYVLHVFIAGWGMFEAVKSLKHPKKTALLIGIAYMFSGFFIGNAQHLSWIIAGAWMPHVFSRFIHLTCTPNFKNATLLSFFGFLMFSGGYPAFVFVLMYVLVGFTIYFLIAKWKNKIEFIKYVKYLVFSILLFIITSSVVIFSFIEAIPYITRASSLEPDKILFGHLHPSNLSSLIAPFSVAIGNTYELYGTDISMMNVYFGFLIIPFIIISFVKPYIRLSYFFLGISIIMLLISVGIYTPLRLFISDYVPLMNLFKFPALFRLFFIFFILLFSASGISQLKEIKTSLKEPFYWAIGLLLLIILALILYFRSQTWLNLVDFIINNPFRYSDSTFFEQNFVFQASIQILLLIILTAFMVFIKTTSVKYYAVLFLFISEVFISTQLNSAYTVHDQSVTLKSSQNYLNQFSEYFPLPNNYSVSNQENIIEKQVPFWRNLSLFSRQVSGNGFTPFVMNRYKILLDSFPELNKSIAQNKVAFFSSQKPSSILLKNTKENPELLSSFEESLSFSEKNAVSEKSIVWKEFSPRKIELNCKLDEPKTLIILQSNHKDWELKVNNNITEINEDFILFMGINLPEGNHKVELQYKPIKIIISFYISLFSLIFSVLFIFYSRIMEIIP